MEKMNRSIDLNDRLSSHYDTSNQSVAETISPFEAAMIAAKKCQVENNPLKEIMQEEGRNLSPS